MTPSEKLESVVKLVDEYKEHGIDWCYALLCVVAVELKYQDRLGDEIKVSVCGWRGKNTWGDRSVRGNLKVLVRGRKIFCLLSQLTPAFLLYVTALKDVKWSHRGAQARHMTIGSDDEVGLDRFVEAGLPFHRWAVAFPNERTIPEAAVVY